MDHQVKYLLQESELPQQWYNVIPDLPAPPPPGGKVIKLTLAVRQPGSRAGCRWPMKTGREPG